MCGSGFGRTMERRPEARTPNPGVCSWRVDTDDPPQELVRSVDDDSRSANQYKMKTQFKCTVCSIAYCYLNDNSLHDIFLYIWSIYSLFSPLSTMFGAICCRAHSTPLSSQFVFHLKQSVSQVWPLKIIYTELASRLNAITWHQKVYIYVHRFMLKNISVLTLAPHCANFGYARQALIYSNIYVRYVIIVSLLLLVHCYGQSCASLYCICTR